MPFASASSSRSNATVRDRTTARRTERTTSARSDPSRGKSIKDSRSRGDVTTTIKALRSGDRDRDQDRERVGVYARSRQAGQSTTTLGDPEAYTDAQLLALHNKLDDHWNKLYPEFDAPTLIQKMDTNRLKARAEISKDMAALNYFIVRIGEVMSMRAKRSMEKGVSTRVKTPFRTSWQIDHPQYHESQIARLRYLGYDPI